MCQNARFTENVENLQPSDDRELNDSKLIISLEWILTTISPGPKCLKKWKQKHYSELTSEMYGAPGKKLT